MRIGVMTLFQVGLGPSSSHTVGPMRAACAFRDRVARASASLTAAERSLLHISVDLYGSLAATGRGHGTFRAVLLGLEGHLPDRVSPQRCDDEIARIRGGGELLVPLSEDGSDVVPVRLREEDLRLHPLTRLPLHPNGMRFVADAGGRLLTDRYYFSVGGGFLRESSTPDGTGDPPDPEEYGSFASGAELVAACEHSGKSISQVMLDDELQATSLQAIHTHLDKVAQVMLECIDLGFHAHGMLPGGLNVRRRAAGLYEDLMKNSMRSDGDSPQTAQSGLPAAASDWVAAAAMAVNEQNAAGQRVVTAPTNGAAGIVPAVLYYALRFAPGLDSQDARSRTEGIRRYLLAAAAVGTLFKRGASISGAEVGCQGEVGSAAAMAAAGLAEVMGGTPAQVENAAEIAMEHHLGLTCDPIGGLVQIPCIERNAVGANTAIVAARTALRGDGRHRVSLDEVIETMRQTGADMNTRYKETARGGLAVNVADC